MIEAMSSKSHFQKHTLRKGKTERFLLFLNHPNFNSGILDQLNIIGTIEAYPISSPISVDPQGHLKISSIIYVPIPILRKGQIRCMSMEEHESVAPQILRTYTPEIYRNLT